MATSIEVQGAVHWSAWEWPRAAMTIDSVSGWATPRVFRASFDAGAGADRFEYAIGDERTYGKLLDALRREGRPQPQNVRLRQATVAGVPVFKGGESDGEPVMWYYYHGGVREAGSAAETAAHVLDDDPATFWQPTSVVTESAYELLAPQDRGPVYPIVADDSGRERRALPGEWARTRKDRRRLVHHSRSLKDWYVEIDLGRVVPVKRIVLRYPDGEDGDPLRLVRILGTPSDDRAAALSLIARTVSSNEDRLVDEFDLDPEDTGHYELIHRLRIAVVDSRLDRGTRVSPAVFAALPLDEQGTIEYYVVDALGGQTRVDPETWERLNPERQGRRVFWRFERPRLAEVEVWSEGDNMAAGVLTDGGADLVGDFEADGGFDGLYDTYYVQVPLQPEKLVRYRGVSQDNGLLTVDLGAVYWIRHLRSIMSCCRAGEQIVFLASDGGRDANGELAWVEAARREREGEPVFEGFTVEARYEAPLRARYLRSYVFQPEGRSIQYRTQELQVYGEGHPAEVSLTSPMIPLGPSEVADWIEWEAESPVEDATEVEVRTRSGDRVVEETTFYNTAGFPKNETEWGYLPAFSRGPKVTKVRPGQGWSPWSRPYDRPGAAVTSPSPRRWLQVQVRLRTSDPAVAPRIRSLRVGLRTAAARRVVGEIWPEKATVGEEQTFEIHLRPSFLASDSPRIPIGFDELLLDAGSLEDLVVLDVTAGSEAELADGKGKDLMVESTPGTKPGQVILRLPRRVTALPPNAETREYHRVLLTPGEVPVDEDGVALVELTYLRLPVEERGRVLYLRKAIDGRIDTVNRLDYQELSASGRSGVRYFRKVEGGEFPFDLAGEPLTEKGYAALSPAERGTVVAEGEVLRLRLRGTAARYGTTVGLWVRDSAAGPAWQGVDPGDATKVSPGSSLTLLMPLGGLIQDLSFTPRVMSPNDDGLNDVLVVRFALPRALSDQRVELTIHDLSGRSVRRLTEDRRGLVELRWDGFDDNGQRAPPGLYVCRLGVEAQARGPAVVRVVALVY